MIRTLDHNILLFLAYRAYVADSGLMFHECHLLKGPLTKRCDHSGSIMLAFTFAVSKHSIHICCLFRTLSLCLKLSLNGYWVVFLHCCLFRYFVALFSSLTVIHYNGKQFFAFFSEKIYCWCSCNFAVTNVVFFNPTVCL